MGVNLGSAYGEIIINTSGVSKGLDSARDSVRGFESSLKTIGKTLAVAGAVMTGVATKITLTAARTEELGIVMRNMAKNAGVSVDALEEQERAIKDLGITTQVADELLIQFMRYQLDATQATDLARLAQDAAVISMQDSSEALQGLLHGIVTYNPRVLRTYGITVDLQQAFLDYAHSVGKTALELTAAEKQQITLNEVLAQGGSIAGTYEAAMGSAGKQLRSMRRHVEEASNAFGQYLLPALGAAVQAGTDFLKWMQSLPGPVQATVAQVGALGGGLATLAGGAVLVGPKLVQLGSAVSGLASSLGLSTAALLGPVGLIAALGTAVVYLANVEKAHRQEAAEILKVSTSYQDYSRQIRKAGLESYQMSEGLYDVAQAAQAAGEAFDALELQEAQQHVTSLSKTWQDFAKSIPTFTSEATSAGDALELVTDQMEKSVREMSDMELVVAANKDEMFLLAQSMGYTGTEALAFAEAINQAAEAQQDARWFTEIATSSLEPWIEREREAAAAAGEVTGAMEGQAAAVGQLSGAFQNSKPAILEHIEAMQAAKASAEELAEAEAAFGEEMDLLHEAMSGTIGPDFEALKAGYAELQAAIASGAEGIDEMTAAMQRQREAFMENTNAIIYNIAEKQIMSALEQGLIEDVNASGSAYDEASGAAVRLAETLGLVDQGTVLLTQAVMEEVNAFIAGEETAGAMAGKLDTLAGNMADAAERGRSLDGAIRDARLAMERGEQKAGSLSGKMGDLSGRLNDAAGSASGLSGELNAIPRDIKVNVNVHTSYTGGRPPAVVDPGTGEAVTTPGGDYAYQHGGQFTVKGPGGIDRVPVFFRATAGEVVTVTPPGQVPPPDPRALERLSSERLMQTLAALIGALQGMQRGGATGPAGQYLNVYGGLHLAGVNDMDSLLGQLAGMTT